MPWAKNGLIRQGENLLAIGAKGVGVGDSTASHGTRKNRITNNGNRLGKSMNKIRDSAHGMPASPPCINAKLADLEMLAGFERNCAIERFPRANPRRSPCFFQQSIQVKNMIGVNMRDKNLCDVEPLRLRKIQHGLTIAPCVEKCRIARGGIPHDVGRDGHVVKFGLETCQTIQIRNWRGLIARMRDG